MGVASQDEVSAYLAEHGDRSTPDADTMTKSQ